MTYTAAVPMVRWAALCALLGLCLLAGLLPQAGAVSALPTFTVTRTADDLNPGSLRSAIAQAAAVGGRVVFNIPATDPGFNSTTGATITLSLGPLVVPSSLSIVGPNMPSGAVVVSGAPPVNGQASINSSRVFSVTGGTVAFSNLTIQKGNASQNNVNFPETDGGGDILNSANLTLNNCQVYYGTSYGGGGGINNSATLVLNNCQVNYNITSQMGGGILNTATLTLTGCTVTGNVSIGIIPSSSGNGTGPGGGGINNSGSGAGLTMTNCTVSQNDGRFGAGGIENSGTILLTSCLFDHNFVEDYGNGGGLFNTGTATLSGCTFNTNFLDGQGDGGGAYNSGALTLSGCLVDNNRAEAGGLGGGGLENDTGGTLVLSACTVSRSQAGLSNGGGGINNFGTAQITNCLVLNNIGNDVGGMFNSGTLTLINSTFTGNLSATGAENSSVPSAGGLLSGPATLTNDIFYFDFDNYQANSPDPPEITAASGTAGPTVTYSDVQQATGVYLGTGNINADPQFVRNPLSDFNAALDAPGDEHLQVTSPAIHTGTNGPGVPFTDIEGTPRPTPPARPSMGAYEVSGSAGSFSAQGGFTVTVTQGQSTGSQVVAQFLPGTTPVSSVTASVAMGDGSVIPGVIAPDPTAPGVFQVTVSHTYTSPGTFPITVVISGPNNTPTATVTSTAVIQPILASLTFPSPVPGGTVVTATVTLTGVTSSDVVVGTRSSDPSVVRINRGVIIPAGSSSATFTINTFRSHVTQTVTIQATAGQVAQTANLTITGR